ncbi:MAG TPA: hypothetical protein VK927_01755 [Adhaeribacter sp.]|nr:hypothetical protein [Adhaeribacter sp.]
MNIQAIKIELVKLILELENPALIKKINKLLTEETSDFYDMLSAAEKEEIQMGLKQLDKGEKIAFNDFLKKVS